MSDKPAAYASTILSEAAIKTEVPLFFDAVRGQLEKGAKEYGDSSLGLPVLKTIAEMKAECLDICGWGFFLWRRLDNLEQAIKSISGDPRSPLSR